MSKRSLLAAGVGAAMLLSACGGSDSGEGGQTELTWWMVSQQESGTQAIDQVIEDFEAENPDITVSVEYRAVDAHKDALRTSAGTSAGPDLYYMWAGPGLGGEFVESGVSLDLSDYYEEYGWADRFPEGTLANYTQYEGYHGVPWTQRGEVIYYNTKLFEEAGITEAPTSYDELVEVAQQLKDAGITPISFGGKDNWHVMRLLDALIETNCGAELGDELNTLQASWDGEECISESFSELREWADNYFNEGFISIAQGEASSVFYAGQSAMQFEGDWFTQNAIDNGMAGEDLAAFKFPTGTDRLYGFSEGQYISAASENPGEAAEFLDYLTSTEVQQSFGGTFGAVSVNTEVQPEGEAVPVAEQLATFIAEAPGYYLNNDQNFPTNVATEYWRIQNAVLTGDIAPEDAGAEFQKFVDSNT